MTRPLHLALITLLALPGSAVASPHDRAAAPAAAVQETTCDGNFHIVHELGGDGELYDLDFAGPNDGWAVGFDYENDSDDQNRGVETLSHGPQERPWVVRFGPGNFESITPPHELGMQLLSVEAVAPDAVYAAGYRFMRRGRSDTIVYRWDGASWLVMDTPSPGVRAYLKGIVAVSPSDMWAVGHFSRRGEYGSRTLVLHFDGMQWKRVWAPSPARFPTLTAVDSVSPDQVWAVGGKGTSRPLVLRWNGNKWRQVKVPRRIRGSFEGVDVVARNELWASGRHVVRYAERRWRRARTPDLRGGETYLDVAAGSDDVWSVGHRFVLRPYETVIPLAVRRSAGEWQRTSFEGNRYGLIEAVALDHIGAAWAVGETFDPEGPDVGDVIERACSP